jgi:hypothetical protein
MSRPEKREEVGIWANFRVKLDTNNFNVVGGVGAFQLVSWVRDVTLRVAHFSFDHTRQSLKGKLNPPETSSSELSELVIRVVWLV